VADDNGVILRAIMASEQRQNEHLDRLLSPLAKAQQDTSNRIERLDASMMTWRETVCGPHTEEIKDIKEDVTKNREALITQSVKSAFVGAAIPAILTIIGLIIAYVRLSKE